MLEQLQSLMKALEAGGYNVQDGNGGNGSSGQILINDGTGQISWVDAPGQAAVKEYYPASPKPRAKTPHFKHCDHNWAEQEGFMLGYKYCGLCRETIKC